jgi:hypothetical protein
MSICLLGKFDPCEISLATLERALMRDELPHNDVNCYASSNGDVSMSAADLGMVASSCDPAEKTQTLSDLHTIKCIAKTSLENHKRHGDSANDEKALVVASTSGKREEV